MAMTRTMTRSIRVAAAISTGLALTVGGAGVAAAATGAATTSVNIRSGPSTGSSIRATLVRGQRVTVTSQAKAGWVRVHFAGSNAYIASKYIDYTGALPSAPKRISTSGVKIATETLNMRSGPSSKYRVVGRLAEGRRITLTGRQSGGYVQTTYGGHIRWVSSAYLAKARSGAGSSGSTGSTGGGVSTSAAKGRAALAFAQRQLGKPYKWGAEGPSSYDCSGLVLAAWNSVGVSMPRTARAQYAGERRIAKSQLRPGDLVFYYSQTPRHVAMYVGNGRIIHAPRPGTVVRYSTLNAMPYSGAVRPS